MLVRPGPAPGNHGASSVSASRHASDLITGVASTTALLRVAYAANAILRQDRRREDVSEIGRSPARVQYGKRECNFRHCRAQQGGGIPRVESAEVPLCEQREPS